MDFYTGHCFFKKVLLFVMCFVCSDIETDAQDYYRLITSTSELEANAKYLIASMAEGDGYVMKNYASGDNNCKGIATTSDGGIIAFATGMAKLTLMDLMDNSSLKLVKDENDRYMTTVDKDNTYLKFAATNGTYSNFSVAINSNAVITCSQSNKILGFNPNNKLFSCYTGGMSPVYLYKLTELRAVKSLSISGTLTKKSYKIGDKVSADGLIVKASFEDGTVEDVTENVVWSFPHETITDYVQKLIVTATYAGKTVSASFDISTQCTYTLDLASKSYASQSKSQVVWNTGVGNMILSKNTATNDANKQLGGYNSSYYTSAYSGHKLTISSTPGLAKIVFTVYDTPSATKFANHIFTNAVPYVSGKEIELLPTDPAKDISIDFKNVTNFTRLTVHTTISVAMSDARYATLCLPYAANIPEGLEVYAAKDNGDKVRLMKKEDIAANEGVVLYGEAGVTYSFAAKYGTVEKTSGNEMVGVNVATILTKDDDVYLLGKNNTTGKVAFRLLSTDRTMVSHRAYLKPDKASASRMLIDISDDTETGIETVPGRENGAEATRIYNLAGQRMSRATKGINIVNGKLTIK